MTDKQPAAPSDEISTPGKPRHPGGRPRLYATKEEYRAAMNEKRKENRKAKNLAKYEELKNGPAVPPVKQQTLQELVLEVISPLSVQDAAFVTEVCGGATYAKAYERVFPDTKPAQAGPAGSRKAAELAIQSAIAAIKARLADRVAYDFTKFMAELDDAMVFAKATGSAPALVRAVELRGKATGQLADKDKGQSGVGGFTLIIGGLDNPTAERLDG